MPNNMARPVKKDPHGIEASIRFVEEVADLQVDFTKRNSDGFAIYHFGRIWRKARRIRKKFRKDK